MRKMIISSFVTAVMVLTVIGAAAWATGVVTPGDILQVTDPGVDGVFHVEGEVSIDGTEMSMPFSATIELIDDDPQLRSLNIGERLSVDIPRVLRPQVDAALGDYGVKYIGEAAKMGLVGLPIGFHIDTLRVEFRLSIDAPIENPYRYECGASSPYPCTAGVTP